MRENEEREGEAPAEPQREGEAPAEPANAAAKPDRLDLARWIVDPANPLTARVAVNRFWQWHFGRGLVNTGDDFGTQGEPPSHPELLDWLASEFMQPSIGDLSAPTGNQPPGKAGGSLAQEAPGSAGGSSEIAPGSAGRWRMKRLHKLIVMSATYRQSSAARPELYQRDPYNTWLARQNRLRFEAEVVRDAALAASGLLNATVGGRSVRPPQPPEIASLSYAGSVKWVDSTGPDRYRRGLYTWFQRTSPYPALMTFDSPDSNLPCTRRERSNTPLQALTLLNDVVFVECAQALGRRILRAPTEKLVAADGTGGGDDLLVNARVQYAFQLCLARKPSDKELARMLDLYNAARTEFDKDTEAAKRVTGEASTESRPPAESAAWTVVARTLLNLDEFITRE
jgi:hypothetical protein